MGTTNFLTKMRTFLVCALVAFVSADEEAAPAAAAVLPLPYHHLGYGGYPFYGHGLVHQPVQYKHVVKEVPIEVKKIRSRSSYHRICLSRICLPLCCPPSFGTQDCRNRGAYPSFKRSRSKSTSWPSLSKSSWLPCSLLVNFQVFYIINWTFKNYK